MEVVFTKRAFRELSRLDRVVQRRIMDKFESYFRGNNPLKFADHLTDFEYGEWRFRIGDYRILGDVSGVTFTVLKVGHRRDVYE